MQSSTDDLINSDDPSAYIYSRYMNQMYYTRLGGKLLVALPHNASMENQSKNVALSTRNLQHSSLPASIFDLSASAYTHLMQDQKDQSILLLGESGSGKSISRSHLTRNLCDLGRLSDGKKSKVHSKILKVDSILSAFGHASTSTNSNATCFMPYMEFQYNSKGKIVGLKLIEYLLDKSRVSEASSQRRSFHIFYNLFQDLTREELEGYGLTDPLHFNYLASTLKVQGPTDRPDSILSEDLSSLGIGKRSQVSLWNILAAILHLGNILFYNDSSSLTVHQESTVKVKNQQKLEQVANMLGISSLALQESLSYRVKRVGRDNISTLLDAAGAQKQRDCLANTLYSAVFTWIIEKINESLCLSDNEWSGFVSLLDLPGASTSSRNDLQALLVNYANETLQHLMLTHLVDEWKSNTADQKLSLTVPSLPIPSLDLYSSLFYAIDYETIHGTNDLDLNGKLLAANSKYSSFMNLSARSPSLFGVKHYMGDVEYDCIGFSEKNSDTLQVDFVRLIRGSPEHPGTSDPFIRFLFSDRFISTAPSAQDKSVYIGAAQSPIRFPSIKRRKSFTSKQEPSIDLSGTVASDFKHGFEDLLNTIRDTTTWYGLHLSLGPGRKQLENIKRQADYYNLESLKSVPSLLYTIEMSIEQFEKKYKTPSKTLKKEQGILIGKTSVYLKEAFWVSLERALLESSGLKPDQQNNVNQDEQSERDDETMSHYGSEFGFQKIANPSGNKAALVKQNTNDSLIEKSVKPVKEKRSCGQSCCIGCGCARVDGKKVSRSRKCWLSCVWIASWPFLPFLLSLCGMRDRQRKMAWREKFAICSIILLLNALVLFLIIGVSVLLCPSSKGKLSPGQISEYSSLNDKTLVFLYGKYYYVKREIEKHISAFYGESGQNTKEFYERNFLGRDVSQIFPKDLFWSTYCPGFPTKPPAFSLFPPDVSSYNPTMQNVRHPLQTNQDYIATYFNTLSTTPPTGTVVWDIGTLWSNIDRDMRYIIAYNKVYDVTPFYGSTYAATKSNFLGNAAQTIFDSNSKNPKIDSTAAFEAIKNKNPVQWTRVMSCMDNMFYVGEVDTRNSQSCRIANGILLAASCILASVIGFKFLAALQCTAYKQPEDHDKFVICQIPCYTEGEASLLASIASLANTFYDDKHKLIFIICDGMIIGSGNDRPTPRIVLDILGVDPNLDPEPLAYHAVGEGNKQLNYAKVYSGLYEVEGHTTPYIVVVKVGKDSERQKPGNRGKRDSQLILMRFLSKVHFNQAMSPLELELYHHMKNIVGVDPSFYEFILMVDADTQVYPDAISRLVSHMIRDTKIAATCGETKMANERDSWVTMIQIYEYFISHHLSKAFESLFSTVTCLPGCFSMYRIRSTVKNIPVLTSPSLINEYSRNQVDTLHLKNLLHLGEDRYMTTLLLKHFPLMKTTFTPDAICLTNAPDKWNILLSQRRRWINSTIHNLMELVFLKELCGLCCFSMRFVVFIDLFATIVQPASLVYIGYLIYVAIIDPTAQIPIISIGIIAAMYGLQMIIFLIKMEWTMIGWMVFYLLATPIFGFFLPIYSFWNMDDFTWGNTRLIVEEKGKIIEKEITPEPFDPSSVPNIQWQDVDRNKLPNKQDWDTKTERSDYTMGKPEVVTSYQVTMPSQQGSPTRNPIDNLRRRSLQSNRSEMVSVVNSTRFPSDTELLNEIRHILSTSDLMTITKKKIRIQLSEFFGVDVTPKKDFIHQTIDGILRGNL